MEITATSPIESVTRISSTELARRPGQLMDEVLRQSVVIVQNRGRDIAALLDIEEYNRLLELLGQANDGQSRPHLGSRA